MILTFQPTEFKILWDEKIWIALVCFRYPSIVETIPPEFPSLKHEFSKLENQILTRQAVTLINTPKAKFWPQLDLRAPRSVPLTPVLPAAHDRWVLRQRLRFRFNFSLWDLSWESIKQVWKDWNCLPHQDLHWRLPLQPGAHLNLRHQPRQVSSITLN